MQLEFWLDDECVIITDPMRLPKGTRVDLQALLTGDGRLGTLRNFGGGAPDDYTWLNPEGSHIVYRAKPRSRMRTVAIAQTKRDASEPERMVYRLRSVDYCRDHGYPYDKWLKAALAEIRSAT